MKSLFIALALSCMAQPISATIAVIPQTEQFDLKRNKNKDHPRLKTYHRPGRVFAPIKLGGESIWLAFGMLLVLTGYVGQFVYSEKEIAVLMGIVAAFLLVLEVLIVLAHPIIWLIRWIRLLHWQMVWRKRYRACPGQY